MSAVDLDTPAATDSTAVVDGPPRWARVLLIGVAVLPVVTAIVRSLRRDWFPIGDNALLHLRAADVFTEHHPLLGSWTSASLSFGVNVNNPGAIYDLLIFPFARTLAPGPGAAIGVGLVNIGSIIGIAMVSRHVGGWRMQRWMIAASAALAWAMGSELLIDLWQANALLLPSLFFVVLLVGCTSGRPVCFPWAVFVGSVLIQTHISYAYILVMLIGAALVTAWFVHRPSATSMRHSLRSRTALVSVGVFVMVWFPSFYEQLFGAGQGNLSRLATNSGGGDLSLGVANATRITGAIIALPPWWMRWGFASTVPNTTPLTRTSTGTTFELLGMPGIGLAIAALLVGFCVLAVLTVAVHRRGLIAATCAGALAAVSIPATVIALSLLTIGPVGLSSHHVRWVWAISAFITFVIAWLGTEWWTTRRAGGSANRWCTGTAVGVTVVLSLANIVYLAHPVGPVAAYADMPAMRRVLPEIGVLADHDPVVYDVSNLRIFEPFSSTMMMRMQQLGIEFRVTDEILVRQLGESRRADGSQTTRVFQLEGLEALDYGGPACTVALASALTPASDAEARLASDRLAGELADGTIEVDADALDPTEPVDQLAAARSGDLDAARLLVIDGALARWAAASIATSADGRDLAGVTSQIMRWVESSYGLFAEGPWDCPS